LYFTQNLTLLYFETSVPLKEGCLPAICMYYKTVKERKSRYKEYGHILENKHV